MFDMKKLLPLLLLIFCPIYLAAHCQLPCGIYHDDLRFASLEEDIQTLNKAIAEIKKNSCSSAEERNQLVRSVNLKDQYADKIVHTMTFYFIQQRLKPEQKNLTSLLNSAFNILQLAVKVKASVDSNLVNSLNGEIANFKSLFNQTE